MPHERAQPDLLPHAVPVLTADWWSRPEFVCYNLNIGSVVAAPAHGEVVNLPHSAGGGGTGGTSGGKGASGSEAGAEEGKQGDGQESQEPCYTLRAFAHTGGLPWLGAIRSVLAMQVLGWPCLPLYLLRFTHSTCLI